MRSKRIRAGLYEITTATGRVFWVEQVRTETPGYGVEHNWWVNAADDGPEPLIDPQPTKRDALAAISYL